MSLYGSVIAPSRELNSVQLLWMDSVGITLGIYIAYEISIVHFINW